MGYPVDRIQLYNQNGVPLPELYPNEIESRVRHEEINGEHTLTLVTKRRLDVGWRALTVDGMGKWREWVVEQPDQLHEAGLSAVGTYRLVWSLEYDLTYTYDDSGDLGHREIGIAASASGKAAMTAAIAGSRKWTVAERSDVPAIAAGGGVVMIAQNAWKRLSSVVKAWGGEVEADIEVGTTGVTSRKVAFVTHVGKTTPTRRFEWGIDLTSIRRTPDPGPYYCRIVPIGRGTTEYANGPDGSDPLDDDISYEWPLSLLDDPEYFPYDHEWIEDAEVVEAFRVSDGNGGWEYPTKIVNYDYDDVELLYNAAVEDMPNHTRPNVTYEASVAQFARAGFDAKGVALGDEIQIVDRGFNPDAELRIQERVTSMDIDELDDDRTELVIGQKHESIADTIASMNTSFDETVERLQYYTTPAYVRDLINWMNDEINRSGGYTYLVPGRGQITYDVAVSDPNVGAEATKAVEIRGGYIRIGRRTGSDGAWEWNSVFSDDGTIAANMVVAAHLTAGTIGSAASGNYWDLDNGTFRMGDTAMIGDGGTTVSDLIIAVDVMYAEGTSSTTPPQDGAWVTTCPAWREGYYVWQKTVTTTSAGESESDPVCISGRDGVSFNNATIMLYKRSASKPAVPGSDLTYSFDGGNLTGNMSGWDNGIPSGEETLWVTSAVASSTGDSDTILSSEWSEPVQVVQNGRSNAVVALYQRAASQPSKPSGTFTYTFATGTLSGGRPGSWTQAIPSGSDPCWVTCATASSTSATDTISGSEFSSPVVFVENGEHGVNTATIILYKRAASEPTAPTASVTYTFSTESLSGSLSGWQCSVPSGSNPCWITSAVASSSTDTDTIASTEWSTVQKFVENGMNQATVYLYQRAEAGTTPSKPIYALTYTFATGLLSGTINRGWSQTIPSGSDPCWLIAATAISSSETDTIGSSEWSDPAILVSNGLNTATIFLYLRTSSTTPVTPTGTMTYTFSTGALTGGSLNGWSRDVPDGDDPCWIITATAASTGDTDTIASSEWSEPNRFVKNGLNQATIYLYKSASSKPTGSSARPTGTLTYTFSDHTLTPSNRFNGWSQTVPSGSGLTWVICATATSTSSTDTIDTPEWTTPVQMTGKDGRGIKKVVEQYCLVNKGSSPTSSTSWSESQQAVIEGKAIWTRSKITWDDDSVTYSDPVLAEGINGAYAAITKLDNDLDPSEIFARLTNNGQYQGLEKDPDTGDLYISATYIGTGIIASASGLSYFNLDNGTMRMVSEGYASGYYNFAELGADTAYDSNGNQTTVRGFHIEHNTSSHSGNPGMITLAGSDGTWEPDAYYKPDGTYVTTGYTRRTASCISSYGSLYLCGMQSRTNAMRPYVKLGAGSIRASLLAYNDDNLDTYLEMKNEGLKFNTYGSGSYYATSVGLTKISISTAANPSVGYDWNYVRNGGYSDAIQKTSWLKTHNIGGNYILGKAMFLDDRIEVKGAAVFRGSLSVSGSKSRVVDTDDYGERMLYCYETSSPMFGDVGSGIIDETGVCVVSIDDILSEAMRTDITYYVFLQKCGPGDLWVSEKHSGYFVVEGTPNLSFDWEIKARQTDYEYERLETRPSVLPEEVNADALQAANEALGKDYNDEHTLSDAYIDDIALVTGETESEMYEEEFAMIDWS